MLRFWLKDDIRRVHRLRPPCPRCQRKMWPATGLDDQLIFRCQVHADWIPESLEDDDGTATPYFRWQAYDWRLT